jgi:CheY-like chemotaxis protein
MLEVSGFEINYIEKLLVEDDRSNVIVFSKILTKRGGLAVKHTENVEEVMQIVHSGEVDIILMDIDLRNSRYQGKAVSGIQITQMLKANPQTAKVPVILVTASVMEGDSLRDSFASRENFLKLSGADGYIPKPVIDHQEFVDQILELLPKD